jgi:hypothetical protein
MVITEEKHRELIGLLQSQRPALREIVLVDATRDALTILGTRPSPA